MACTILTKLMEYSLALTDDPVRF